MKNHEMMTSETLSEKIVTALRMAFMGCLVGFCVDLGYVVLAFMWKAVGDSSGLNAGYAVFFSCYLAIAAWLSYEICKHQSKKIPVTVKAFPSVVWGIAANVFVAWPVYSLLSQKTWAMTMQDPYVRLLLLLPVIFVMLGIASRKKIAE